MQLSDDFEGRTCFRQGKSGLAKKVKDLEQNLTSRVEQDEFRE